MADEERNIELAEHYVRVGQPQRALDALASAGDGALELPGFWWLQAVAHFDLEQSEAAAKAARSGLEGEPHSVDLLTILALAETDRGHLAEAEQAALAALEIDPQDPALLCAYARVVARGGQLDKASALVDRAAAVAPEYEDVVRMRALIAYLRGRDREAAGHAEDLLAADPENISAHRLRGAALAQRGDIRGASRSFETAVSGDPTDHALAEATRRTRAALHPLLLPMWPVYRLGVAGTWIVAVGTIFGLRALGLGTAAGIAAVVWIVFVIYSWTVVPALERRFSSPSS